MINTALVIDPESLQELQKAIENANTGNWFPFAIVCGALSLVVLLFIYILNMKDKENTRHHEQTDSILEKITETQQNMSTIIAVHENEINNLKKTG